MIYGLIIEPSVLHDSYTLILTSNDTGEIYGVTILYDENLVDFQNAASEWILHSNADSVIVGLTCGV
jgi:hypothetical protein